MTIEYRAMQISDVDRIADILAGTWHEYATGEVAHLHGLIDLATYALRHTYSQVAVMDGQVEGVILARAGMPSDEETKPWQDIIDASYKRADEIDKQSTDDLRNFLAAEYAADGELLRESACNPDFELVVFVVSPETRGHGVGTKLMASAMLYLESQGAETGYLFTDTSCIWEYYEHRGMRRAAERTYDSETPILPERMFVYEFDVKN